MPISITLTSTTRSPRHFRGKLLYTPTEKLTIDLRAHSISIRMPARATFMPGSDFFLPLPPPNPPIIVDVPEYEIQSNKVGESFVEVERSIGEDRL